MVSCSLDLKDDINSSDNTHVSLLCAHYWVTKCIFMISFNAYNHHQWGQYYYHPHFTEEETKIC